MLNAITNTLTSLATAAGVISSNPVASDNLATTNTQAENPASIVELSAQAQTLSQAASAAQAELTQTELTQAALTQEQLEQTQELQTEYDDALAFQQNLEQLTEQSIQAQAVLTQNLATAQLSVLDSTETTAANQALQSALADAALNEAIAATATTAAASTTATPTVNLSTANTPTTTTATEAATASPTNTNADEALVVEEEATVASEANLAGQVAIAATADETTPITDPSIAAAIAAYRVNDTIAVEGEPLVEQAPPEKELDVEATTEIQETKVDLHDSARDEPINGAAWNWQRINPLQRKSSRG